MTDRKKPGVAFWAPVVAVVVAGYPLSAGPVTLLFVVLNQPHWMHRCIGIIYTPLMWTINKFPEAVPEAFNAYLSFWLALGRR